MKIKILDSKCEKGDCPPNCPRCRLNEMFRGMAGDEPYHNVEGVLQESVENIIPPAFNRLMDYAKIGEPPMGESMLDYDTRKAGDKDPQVFIKAMADYVEKNKMSSKTAQDVFAQYIVRYVTRSYDYRGRSVDFAFNNMSINMMFSNVWDRLPSNVHYDAWYKHTTGREDSYGHPTEDEKSGKIDQNQYIDYEILLRKIQAFRNKFSRRSGSQQGQQWIDGGRKMAADGASAPEILVYMGRHYKSYVKTITKFYKKNPEIASVLPIHMEYIRRAWNYKQDQLISHSMGNLRKIGKFLREEKNVNELAAILKKHPSKRITDPDTRDIIERTSLYHANEFIDNELLKKQLDVCPEGWSAAQLGNAEEDDEGAPCVLHEYDDGFFWWNRKASSCDIAGEEMSNCGASNYSSSTLLILKEKVNNDSMEAMDKIKGRVMVEYNSESGEMVQILGFANSFPKQEYWEKIKDLYENLGGPEVSKWAFQHLRERGKTDQETIDAFLDFLDGNQKARPPESFFFNDSGNSIMDRIRGREYDLETEANFGGRQRLNFDAKHNSTNNRYAPIEVEFTVRALPYPQLPDSLSTDEHPSLVPAVFNGLAEKDEAYENIKNSFSTNMRVLMSRTLVGSDIAAGTASDAAKRMFKTLKYIRFSADKRGGGQTDAGRIRFLIRGSFEIVPEIFTDEPISGPDEPLAELAHNIIRKVRQIFGNDMMLQILNQAIEKENKAADPDYGISGVDQTGAQGTLDLTMIMAEMQQIQRDWDRGTTMTQLADRLENLYASLVQPADHPDYQEYGYMNIDLLPLDTRTQWGEWIHDDDYWSNEWERLERDSAERMRNIEANEFAGTDGPPEGGAAPMVQRNYFGLEDHGLVARWIPPGYGGRRNPIHRGVAGRTVRRILNEYEQFGEDWDRSNIAKAQLNAIDAHYDIEGIGLAPDELEKALNLIRQINGGLPDTQSQRTFDPDDGPDEEERNWRPGMPTPGLRATDYNDALDQAEAEELEIQMQRDEPPDEIDRLLTRGNMLLRYMAQVGGDDRQFNVSHRGTMERFKSLMQDQGIWDQWWSRVADDHPLKVAGFLDEAQVMVESFKMRLIEQAGPLRGGILPFKREGGEFYFLLGRAPQGWWSDFRGRADAQDGGDLMVTAAREFREESSFDLPVSLEDAHRLEHKNSAVWLTDLAEINADEFDINKVMKITKGKYAGVPEIVEVGWYKIDQLPRIANTRMPIIQKAIDTLTAPEPQSTGMETSGGDAYTPYLNEEQNTISTLRIFDFDETIAFTKSETRVTEPTGKKVTLPDQDSLETYMYSKGKEYQVENPDNPDAPPTTKHIEDYLGDKGYVLDFSDFTNVNEPKENEPVVAIIRRMLDSYSLDPRGVVYVITARSQASEGPIKAYLDQLGIQIDEDKIIGVTGGSKKEEIERLLKLYSVNGNTTIRKIEFFDDSDKNLADVRQLKTEYPNIKTVLRKVNHERISTVEEQKKKLFKLRIRSG